MSRKWQILRILQAQLLTSFNGAETKMSRKWCCVCRDGRRTTRFNGAETKMSRKCANGAMVSLARTGFNGAETKMSRKSSYHPVYALGRCMLQWGRDKNVSEIPKYHPRTPLFGPASMGPRQKCLGNDTDYVASTSLCFASMGPRQKCLGNQNKTKLYCMYSRASMGPRQKCLGNYEWTSWPTIYITELQWGRDKNVSEIWECRPKGTRYFFASMGPRQKCLGNAQKALVQDMQSNFASMGPRQKCLGNKGKWIHDKLVPLELQWGRDKNVSEISCRL